MIGSLALVPAFAALVLSQITALPDVTAPPAPLITGCGGCYVVADVAQIVFGSQQITQTVTQVNSAGFGRNGTQFTTTFLQQPVATFSFDPQGLITDTQGTYTFQTGTTFVLSGVTITSPTAYNIFTAYTRTDLIQSAGSCLTSVNSVNLASAYSFPIVASAGPDFIFEQENAFIQSIGGLTCLAGGVTISTTTNLPIVQATTTSTTSGLFRPTPIAQTTAAPSTTSVPPGLTLSTSTNGSVVTLSSSAGTLVTVSPTIAIGAASSVVIPTTFSASLLAALFVLPGVFALAL